MKLLIETTVTISLVSPSQCWHEMRYALLILEKNWLAWRTMRPSNGKNVKCQMSDLIAIWGDGTTQSELEGTYCTVTKICWKKKQMCQLLLLLLCTYLSSEYCSQFLLILNMGYIQDYTYEQQLRTVHKLRLLWTAGMIIYPQALWGSFSFNHICLFILKQYIFLHTKLKQTKIQSWSSNDL